jgi:release factor glutamine methyltransferase
MTCQQAYQELSSKLRGLYDHREAANIADMVLEYISGEKKIDRVLNGQRALTAYQQQLFSAYTERLLQHEPIQYVLGESWFAGLKFYVDKNVLIPRPETEELVNWITADVAAPAAQALTILDIGTGSGCIAVALKKQLPSARVHALDISGPALEIARKNALLNNVDVNFLRGNILSDDELKNVPIFDIIVSNPPYVTKSEAAKMSPHVVQYEPDAALFVSDDNPLLFYEHIAEFAMDHLKQSGMLYLEINEIMGSQVAEVLEGKKFNSIELKKDMQGKDRMLKANRAVADQTCG